MNETDRNRLDNLAITISTCDAYAHVWAGQRRSMKKYLAAPVQIFWMSETKAPDGARSVLAGEGLSWSAMNRTCLQQLPHDDVFFILDDHYLVRNVNTRFILDSLDMRERAGTRVVRFDRVDARVTGPPEESLGDGLFRYGPSNSYIYSCQPMISDRKHLIDMLQGDMNPWQYELRRPKPEHVSVAVRNTRLVQNISTSHK